MTSQQVAQFEALLHGKGTAERAREELESLIARAADDVAALVPGLSWTWMSEGGSIGCAEDPGADTRATRFSTRHAVFEGPIPEPAWPKAFEIVRERAAEAGATGLRQLVDDPNNHDVSFFGPEGQRVDLASAQAALIRGTTPARLREDWYQRRNMAAPADSLRQ
ncbi:MAG: LppA family lipoprotein [Segniliparus sp.]|uniref:LppA family lipoprotein n=1 Tax=Segniliparus sp. TaxID=2804064 RepID=UPI003F2CA700